MNEETGNRWLILIACVVINLCIGAGYAWSVFQKPLIEMFGWTTAQASLAFTLTYGLVPLAMIVFGKAQETKGPKIIILIGGIVFGLGMFLTGFTKSLMSLYITYGVMGGLGIGMVYGCTVATAVQWFPDKRGLAGGLAAAGYGCGAIIFAPVGAALIARSDVLTTFRILGICYLVAIVLCSLLVKSPPKVATASDGSNATVVQSGYTTGEMMANIKFYILWVMYLGGCVSGLMIIGHASPIAQEQIGLSAAVAAVSVSIIAIANTLGRMFWGYVSDKIGRYNSLMWMFIVAGVCMFLLMGAKNFALFIVCACGVALCFGGFLGIFPSITADSFGTKCLGTNYGVMFTAFGVAAIIGPRLAAVVKQSSGGSYGMAFLIAAVLSAVGFILTFIIKGMVKRDNMSA